MITLSHRQVFNINEAKLIIYLKKKKKIKVVYSQWSRVGICTVLSTTYFFLIFPYHALLCSKNPTLYMNSDQAVSFCLFWCCHLFCKTMFSDEKRGLELYWANVGLLQNFAGFVILYISTIVLLILLIFFHSLFFWSKRSNIIMNELLKAYNCSICLKLPSIYGSLNF